MQMEMGARDVVLGRRPDLDAALVPAIQIQLAGNIATTPIRDITSDAVNRLISVPGIGERA